MRQEGKKIMRLTFLGDAILEQKQLELYEKHFGDDYTEAFPSFIQEKYAMEG